MPKLNSVITIIAHLEGVVYFFMFFALLFSTRLFKSLSPSSESWDKGKVTPISKDIFVFRFLTATFFVLQIQCFCFYHLFFHCNKQNAFEKTNQIERKKEDITLQNSAGGKYIYACWISFMPAKKTSNAIQCLVNEL